MSKQAKVLFGESCVLFSTANLVLTLWAYGNYWSAVGAVLTVWAAWGTGAARIAIRPMQGRGDGGGDDDGADVPGPNHRRPRPF